MGNCCSSPPEEVRRGGARPTPAAARQVIAGARTVTQRQIDEEYVEVKSKRSAMGKVVVDSVIGEGNYGVVKRANRVADGQAVALKTIDKSHLGEEELDALPTEAGIMKKVCHPNVIRCYDVMETDKDVVLALELAEGGDLFALYEYEGNGDRKYTESDAANNVKQVANGLFHLHSHDITHRDIKLENILVGENRTLKICDFGFAKSGGGDVMKTYVRSHAATQPRTVHEQSTPTRAFLLEFDATQTVVAVVPLCISSCGTPEYVAPEVIRYGGQKAYTNKCDVWSLGVITHIMLTARNPFGHDARNQRQVLSEICELEIDVTANWWQNISPYAKSFVTECLTKDPEERPDIERVLQHAWLQPASASSDVDISHVPQEYRKAQARRNFRKLVYAVVASNTLKNYNS